MPSYSDPTVISVSESNRIQPGAYVALAAGVVAVLMVGFFFWRIHSTDAKIAQVQLSINESERRLKSLQPVAEDLNRFNSQVKALHVVFDNQKLWEVVLERLEGRLYKRMAVSTLTLNELGNFTLSGTTADYEEYAKIYSSLTDEEARAFFLSVRPTSLTKVVRTNGSSQVDFSFSIVINPSVLDTSPKASPTPAPAAN